jgi:hypothetical protein
MLTVSSQIKNPISLGGRILDVFMEIDAITVIATLAGALGSVLQSAAKRLTTSADGRRSRRRRLTRLQRCRTGAEGRTSHLTRDYGLDCSRLNGDQGP